MNRTIPVAQGSAINLEHDSIAPIAVWQPISSAQKGTKLSGTVHDLGSGVSGVTVQMQRVADGAVWDGTTWQAGVGEVIQAVIRGQNFIFIVPTQLEKGATYIFRCQAIDAAGNIQTQVNEITVRGHDIGKVESF